MVEGCIWVDEVIVEPADDVGSHLLHYLQPVQQVQTFTQHTMAQHSINVALTRQTVLRSRIDYYRVRFFLPAPAPIKSRVIYLNTTICRTPTFSLDKKISVAEPPHFWAAPAPEVRGPGANSGSDQIGSAPATGKKRRFQTAPAPCTKISHFELIRSELVMQVVFGPHLPLYIAFKSCFVTTTRFSFFACQ